MALHLPPGSARGARPQFPVEQRNRPGSQTARATGATIVQQGNFPLSPAYNVASNEPVVKPRPFASPDKFVFATPHGAAQGDANVEKASSKNSTQRPPDISEACDADTLSTLPAGFGSLSHQESAASLFSPGHTHVTSTDTFGQKSGRSKSGFNKNSMLRHMFNAQMTLYQAGAPVSKPEPEMTEYQKAQAKLQEEKANEPASRPTPRSSDRSKAQQRRQQEIQELNGVVSALRGKKVDSGWDAEAFANVRKKFLAEGKRTAAKGLTPLVANTSRKAVEAGEYLVPVVGDERVMLPTSSVYKWCSFDNLPDKEDFREQTDPPLLVCTSMSACETSLRLSRMYPSSPIVMTFEATDFQPDGQGFLGANDTQNTFQQELMLRTTLEVPARTAAQGCRDRSTIHKRLTRKEGPSILAAPEVKIFREHPDKGYAFLTKGDQPTVSLLVTGRATSRPLISLSVMGDEFFATEEDSISYLDRLHIIGLAAHTLINRTSVGCCGEVATGKGMLVIAAQGLSDTRNPQPRESIAKMLQVWRRQYAHLFEAVVVACGNRENAIRLDRHINSDAYAAALAGTVPQGIWTWPQKIIAWSVNPAMMKMAKQLHGDMLSGLSCELQSCPATPLSPRSPWSPTGGQGRRGRSLRSEFGSKSSTAPLDDEDEEQFGAQVTSTMSRRNSTNRMSLVEHSIRDLTVRPKKSSNVWCDSYKAAAMQREAEEAEKEALGELPPTGARKEIAQAKENRLNSQFVHNDARKVWRNLERDERKDEFAAKELLMKQIAMTILCAKGEKKNITDNQASMLDMPKEVVVQVAREQAEKETRLTPRAAAAEEAFAQVQSLADNVGATLRTRQDEYRASDKFKELKSRGGPVSSFKWE